MIRRIIRRPAAQRDLIRLAKQIAARSPGAARRFRKMAKETYQRLAEIHGLGSPCELENPAVADLLYWPIKKHPNHLILFRRLEHAIDIIRIVHAHQDWQGMFEEESDEA